MSLLFYRADHSFEGDQRVGQLSFPAGATILVKSDRNFQQHGWTYGQFANFRGWFPSSYVTFIPSDYTSDTTGIQNSLQALCNENYGFDGPPMGNAPEQTINYSDKAGFGSAIMAAPWIESTVVPQSEDSDFSCQTLSLDSTKSVHINRNDPKPHSLFARLRTVGHRLTDVTHQKREDDTRNNFEGENVQSAMMASKHEQQYRQPPAEHNTFDKNAVAVTFPVEETKKHGIFTSKTITKQRTETKTKDAETLITVTKTKTKKGLFRTRIYETKTITSRPISMTE
jgi:hypothetical protein